MSKLPEFLQGKSCFDGRPHPAVPHDFLVEFYQREAERKKHMKQCTCCYRWLHQGNNQKFCTSTCKQKYYSRLYAEQRQQEIDYELKNGGWNE